ncbi:MAG: SGNH/GDSL hydrolase family protein [Pseudomonadota bacterium]
MKLVLAFCVLWSSVCVASARTIVFGDSLSDAGNLFTADPSLVPSPPYPDGQFTNGNVWAAQIGSDLASGLNFAWGGATALPAVDGIPDLTVQVANFIRSDANAPGRANVAIWIGANDLLEALESVGLVSGVSDPKDIGISPGAVDLAALNSTLLETADAVVMTIAEEVLTLSRFAEINPNFIVFGLPELGKTPLVRALGPEVAVLMDEVTRYFNAELRAAVEAGELIDIPTTFFDINGEFEEILEDPSAFGIENTTEACLVAAPIGCLLGDPDPNTFLFYDPLHPSARVHEILAEEYLNIVPVPASLPLLLGGLVLVAGMRIGVRKKDV